jgi:CcmD family protein
VLRSRGFRITLLLVLLAVPRVVVAAAAQPPPTAQQSEFVPISELPPGDQLPAAPLLVGAYAFVWVVLLAYLWSIRNRAGSVRAEIERLERRLGEEPARRR